MGDRGSSWVRPPYHVSPLEGLRSYLGDGAEVTASDGSDLELARRQAAEADAVVVVAGFRHDESGEYIDRDGESPRSEAEIDHAWNRMVGGDRYPLGLRERDLALIEAATEAGVVSGRRSATIAAPRAAAAETLPDLDGDRRT